MMLESIGHLVLTEREASLFPETRETTLLANDIICGHVSLIIQSHLWSSIRNDITQGQMSPASWTVMV